jgi:hypothetical protein
MSHIITSIAIEVVILTVIAAILIAIILFVKVLEGIFKEPKMILFKIHWDKIFLAVLAAVIIWSAIVIGVGRSRLVYDAQIRELTAENQELRAADQNLQIVTTNLLTMSNKVQAADQELKTANSKLYASCSWALANHK